MNAANDLEAVGYVRTDTDKVSLALPVIRDGSQIFLQVTYLENLESYDLATYLGEYTPVNPFKVNKNRLKNQRIICFIEDKFEYFLWSDADRDFLQDKLSQECYSSSLRLQIADIINDTESRVELENRNIAIDDNESMAASILRNAFFEATVSNLRTGTVLRDASSASLQACRYVNGPSLSAVPSSVLDAILSFTTISKQDLERILKERAKSFANRSEPHSHFSDVNDQNVREFIELIRNLERQELRISHVLRSILDNPRVALAALKQYKPWTKAEADSIARIERRRRELDTADDRTRSYIVAQLIPDIMRSHFGARRGRLLLDLSRNVGHNLIVGDAVYNEYRRRQHTYSVQFYDKLIRSALDGR